MSTEPVYHALSHLDSDGNPYLNNVTCVVGDGTSKVVFKNGRAEVPHGIAKLIARHPQVDIPGFDPNAKPKAKAKAAAAPAPAPAPELPAAEPAADSETDAAEPAEDLSEEVKAAMEHLAGEGEDVPDVTPASTDRSTFASHTDDGQARCQAAKGDGSQCSNPAQTDSTSCGLPKHVEQLAA